MRLSKFRALIQASINIVFQYSTEGCVKIHLSILLLNRHPKTAYGELGNKLILIYLLTFCFRSFTFKF
jgi:hypothetical protein